MEITYQDFEKVEVRVGRILEASFFKEALKPAYKLVIDFGELGIKKSSAQITQNYKIEDLVGREIIAVVNFPPKQIANFVSEVLVLGVNDNNGNVVLLAPDVEVPLGRRMY
ncbi:MAG: tRNA-binding protein [Caldisericaceae bacterium]